MAVTDGRRPPHDRFEGRRKREAQWLQPGRNQIADLNRDKEANARDLLRISLWFYSDGVGRRVVIVDVVTVDVVIVVVVIAIVVVEIVSAQVRMDPTRSVMGVVMVVRVHVHQRRT